MPNQSEMSPRRPARPAWPRLTKLATASFEDLERDLRARIATLEAQALRYETAIDNISQGVCFFDGDERLILCNRRYAEIYRLAPEQVRPGATLREIVEHRSAAGTCSMAVDDYLTLGRIDQFQRRPENLGRRAQGRANNSSPSSADARRRLGGDP